MGKNKINLCINIKMLKKYMHTYTAFCTCSFQMRQTLFMKPSRIIIENIVMAARNFY